MRDTINYINPQTFDAILDAIPRLKIRKWADDDIRMLFKILYWMGLRPMEGIRLAKEDFNLEDREAYLGNTKTRTQDRAMIPHVFVPELGDWLATKPAGPLFPKLTYNTFYPWLRKLGTMLDIPAWTIPQHETHEKTKGHIFRKSIGKDMLSGVHKTRDGKKFEIPIISKHLRHAKPSITIDHYLKADIEAVKESW